MTANRHNSPTSPRRRWILAVLLVCFGTLAALAPVLHAHELDPTHVEKNCAPCHWSQTHVGMEQSAPDFTCDEIGLRVSSVAENPLSVKSLLPVSSRAPPVLP